LGILDADTAENGFADHANIIVPVSCPVPNRPQHAPKLSGGVVVNILPESRLAKILGRTQLVEEFFCNYEVDADFRRRIETEDTGMRIVANGESGELRGVEMDAHPFYLATLFLPQLTSAATGEPHPIITTYLTACRAAKY
jgi:CTP synthase (UTP-ammonia lyase)